ncbi:MAG: TolC family outer membrane protein [Geminicoccaceae bacterium]
MKQTMRTAIAGIRSGRLRIALLAGAASVALAAGASAGSLQDTVRAAVASNPDVDVVRADRLAVDQELRQARAGYLPSVDLEGSTGPEYRNYYYDRNGRDSSKDDDSIELRSEAQLKVTQRLWDGDEVRSEVERQKARVNSATYRVDEAAEFVALDAVEAHLDVLRNQEIVRLNDANLTAHRRILGQVQELERGGGGDIADVEQTQARIAQADATLAAARGSLADAAAAYERAVGEPPAALSLEPPPLGDVPATSDAAADAASVESPTVQIAASDVDVAAAELRGTRANFYPHFNFEAGGSVGDNVDGEEGSTVDGQALLVMRYNLYRGGADIAREREAFHRVNESRAGLEQARRKAAQEARVSFNALETARARTVALRAKAEAQRRTRDAYAQQFEIGQRDLLDVLDAENELFLARVGLVTAEYNERFAVYRLLAVTGDLLGTLGVAAPREATTITRTPADEQTPAAILDKAKPLTDPRAEPRPLRGEAAGEPPPMAPTEEAMVEPPSSLAGAVGGGSGAALGFAAGPDASGAGDIGAMTSEQFFAAIRAAYGAR